MFKTIGVFGKYRDTSVELPLKELTSHLEDKGYNVKLGHTTAAEITRQLPQERLEETVPSDIDLAIVIGGDGTFLHVARHMATAAIPVAGINLGRLGFLTDIPRAKMLYEVDRILAGEFSIEERMMLKVAVHDDANNLVYEQDALNDIVIGKHALERLISWQAKVDGQLITSARSDGVIFATPTGSTAYALSAGGAIVHPGTDVISLVPVSPHTLSNRPIILPANLSIQVSIQNRTANLAHVSADGLIGYNLHGTETVTVKRSTHSVKIVHTKSYNYFAMLRVKLGWG